MTTGAAAVGTAMGMMTGTDTDRAEQAADLQAAADRLRAVDARVAAVDAFASLPSTNNWLLERGAPPDGRFRVCLAARQSAGRGRLGRRWLSPPGGVYLSAARQLAAKRRGIAWLGLLTALELVAEFGGEDALFVKWPNDVMHARGKLAGVLIETRGRLCVIGVGLNVRRARAAPEGVAPRAVFLEELGLAANGEPSARVLRAVLRAADRLVGASAPPRRARLWPARRAAPPDMSSDDGAADDNLEGAIANAADDNLDEALARDAADSLDETLAKDAADNLDEALARDAADSLDETLAKDAADNLDETLAKDAADSLDEALARDAADNLDEVLAKDAADNLDETLAEDANDTLEGAIASAADGAFESVAADAIAGPIEGMIDGIDDDGRLRLRRADGRIERFAPEALRRCDALA